jgi:hypothetical protein
MGQLCWSLLCRRRVRALACGEEANVVVQKAIEQAEAQHRRAGVAGLSDFRIWHIAFVIRCRLECPLLGG